MGLFGNLFKPKVVKEIYGGAWGHLVSTYKVDVMTLSKEFRCVDRAGVGEGGRKVTLVRVFKPLEAQAKGVVVTGWETFDQHPDLIHFEGYLTASNEACFERKKG